MTTKLTYEEVGKKFDALFEKWYPPATESDRVKFKAEMDAAFAAGGWTDEEFFEEVRRRTAKYLGENLDPKLPEND